VTRERDDAFGPVTAPPGAGQVGLVGTGRMGSAIGQRLLEQGYRLTVHNRTFGNAAPLLAAGADWAASPAELAGSCGVVLTCLLDDQAARHVYVGKAGLLSGDALLPRVFVEMSTLSTAATGRLRDAVLARGGHLIDAPVAGPPEAAREGRLLVLVGGSDEDVAVARPLLDALARRVVHLGPTGAGATMKLVLMGSLGIYFAGLAEVLAMGTRLELDLQQMLDVILDSHGAPPALRDRAPVLLAEAAGKRAAVGFPVAGVRKDLEAVLATARAAGVPDGVAASALAAFTAATDAGYAERDLICITQHVLELTSPERNVSPRAGR
jgi:3-hydroxyisobutyrate dehydrogenase